MRAAHDDNDRRQTMTVSSSIRRAVLLCIAAGAAFGAAAQGAAGWPTKPVTIIVPFPAGGGTDAFARPLSATLTRQLGKQILIDNKGGAGGTLGAGIAANPEASAIDRNMRAMTGGSTALMDEFYVLVAEVFTDLVQGSGGDLGRMQKSLAEGQRDPAGFAAFLSPATLQHLRDLSGRIGDQKR